MAKNSKSDEADEEKLALQNFHKYVESFTKDDLEFAHNEIMGMLFVWILILFIAAYSAIDKKFKNDYGKWKELNLSKSAAVVPNNIKLESSFSTLKQIQVYWSDNIRKKWRKITKG